MPRPLDWVPSFKLKVGLLVVGAIFVATLTFWYTGAFLFRYALLSALAVSLLFTQIMAHGMTSPLREMTAAAKAMAKGDYSRRVHASSRDEIGQLATAFNAMSADLEAVDQNRRELIANVSHELNTPISALQAVLENVVDGVAPADAATMRTALEQTERLGRLVRDLLDLSKLDGGAIAATPKEVGVRPFLDDVARLANVPVTIGVQPPGLSMYADSARLHQVIANLLDNAVRHGPKGGEIAILARGLPHAVQIDVTDEGPGIARAERERVFERFTRGGATDGGTGLGLAIARWAVELHGGSIAVVGDDPGCRIRVVLPNRGETL